MCGTVLLDVTDKHSQFIFTIFAELSFDRKTNSFVISSRQHQLTQTLHAHFNCLKVLTDHSTQNSKESVRLKQQHVLPITGTDRGLHHTMRNELHWLDMSKRVQFRIATTVYRCLHGTAPEYLSELCIPVNQRSSRYRLRSSQSNQLVVPPVKLSTYGPRSFAVAGPTTWNSLPEYLRDPELSMDSFRRQLKTFLFAQYWWRHSSALETFVSSRSINLLFTLHYIGLQA